MRAKQFIHPAKNNPKPVVLGPPRCRNHLGRRGRSPRNIRVGTTVRSAEEPPQPLRDAALIARFAFPNDERMPAGRAQCLDILSISCFVSFQFWQPVSLIRLRYMRGVAAVRMPEAPVNEDHFAPRRKYQIRLSRKVFPVQSEPVAQSVSQAPHVELGLHILASDRAHVGASVHQPHAFCRLMPRRLGKCLISGSLQGRPIMRLPMRRFRQAGRFGTLLFQMRADSKGDRFRHQDRNRIADLFILRGPWPHKSVGIRERLKTRRFAHG